MPLNTCRREHIERISLATLFNRPSLPQRLVAKRLYRIGRCGRSDSHYAGSNNQLELFRRANSSSRITQEVQTRAANACDVRRCLIALCPTIHLWTDTITVPKDMGPTKHRGMDSARPHRWRCRSMSEYPAHGMPRYDRCRTSTGPDSGHSNWKSMPSDRPMRQFCCHSYRPANAPSRHVEHTPGHPGRIRGKATWRPP